MEYYSAIKKNTFESVLMRFLPTSCGSSDTKLCPTLCDSMNCNLPGFPVLHYLPEFAQIHVHESVMLSNHLILFHLLLLPSIFPSIWERVGFFSVSRLFASGGQNIGASASVSVLPMNIQGWFPLGLTGLIYLQSRGLSTVFSRTTILRHQFFGAQPSLWSKSHIHAWLLEKP